MDPQGSSSAMAIINETTLFPLGMVITFITMTVGGVAWLTRLHNDVSSLKNGMNTVDLSLKKEVDQTKLDSDRLIKVEVQLQNVMDAVSEIKSTLSKLEDRLSNK